MAFGRIPRFSPSFSPREALTAARRLLRPPEDAPEVHAFEAEFAEYIGVRHAVMVPSARYGLLLLLRAWEIGPDDEVVVPALTYFAVPAMVAALRARPVFADVHATACTLDPGAFASAITPRTRAVVPTHLFGTPADLDPIISIARENGIKVVEDCAQGTGASYRGRRVGAFGDAAYYTFGLTKNMTTLRGAMITTDDDSTAARVREVMARVEPMDLRPLWKEVAVGSAMWIATHPLVWPFTGQPLVHLGDVLGKDPIHERFAEPAVLDADPDARYRRAAPRAAQAAVGRAQLRRLDRLNGARRVNGRYLDEHLAHVPGLVRPTWPEVADPIFMSYVVQHPRRADLARALRRRGVDTTVGYMTDASTDPLFSAWSAHCPRATALGENLLHLPVHPNMGPSDRRHLAEAVRLAALEVDR